MSYRIVAVERDHRWIARATREDTGRPFGIECAGRTEDEAIERLSVWLEWQRKHTAALAALQAAERLYHRTVAGGAFSNPTEDPVSMAQQRKTLEAVEAARITLDDIRARKPEQHS